MKGSPFNQSKSVLGRVQEFLHHSGLACAGAHNNGVANRTRVYPHSLCSGPGVKISESVASFGCNADFNTVGFYRQGGGGPAFRFFFGKGWGVTLRMLRVRGSAG